MGVGQHKFDARHENIESMLFHVESQLSNLEDRAKHQKIAAKLLLNDINYINSNL